MFTRLLTKPRECLMTWWGNLKQKWELLSKRLICYFFFSVQQKGNDDRPPLGTQFELENSSCSCPEFNSLTLNWINILNESQKNTDKIQMSLKRNFTQGIKRDRLSKVSHMDFCKVACIVPRNKACGLSTALWLKIYGHKHKTVIS